MIRYAGKLIKYSVIIFLLLTVIVMGTGVLLVHFYPKEKVLELIISHSSQFLNRKVHIKKIEYSLRGIVLEDIKIFDLPDEQSSNQRELLRSKEATIKIMPWALLNREFKIWSLSIDDGVLNLNIDKNGNNISQLIEEIQSKSSEGEENQSLKISLKGIILSNFKLKVSGIKGRYEALNGTYKLDSRIKNQNFEELIVSDTAITLPSNRGKIKPNVNISLGKKFNITGTAKLKNVSLNWVYTFKMDKSPLPYEIVNARITNLQIDKKSISGNLTGVSTLRNFPRKLEVSGHCTVLLEPKISVIIDKTRGTIQNSDLAVDKITIDANRGAIDILNTAKSNVLISDLRGIVPEIPKNLSGRLVGSIKYNRGTINGDINLKDIKYTFNGYELCKIEKARAIIRKNEFKMGNIPVVILETNNALLSVATVKNNITRIYGIIKSKTLNLTPLSKIFLKSIKTRQTSRRISIPAYIFGKIYAQEATYGQYKAYNSRIDYSIGGKDIKINDLRTSIFGGVLWGKANISTDKAEPVVQTKLRFNDIQIDEIKFINKQLNRRFFGIAKGKGALRFSLGKKLTESMIGNVTLEISKGKIVNTGIQKGLIFFLSDLKYKLKDLEFKQIYGNIDIRGNNYIARSFLFNSEDVRLSLKGQMNRDLIAQNIRMKLEFNNHFIKDIPRPAVTLLRKYSRGQWYEIPFRINGLITNDKNIKIVK